MHTHALRCWNDSAPGVPSSILLFRMQVYGTKSVCEFLLANQPWKQYLQGGNFTLMPPVIPGMPLQLSACLTVTAAAVPHRAEFSDAVGFYIQVGVCSKTPAWRRLNLSRAVRHLSTGRSCAAGADKPAQSRATTRCLLTLAHQSRAGPKQDCLLPARHRQLGEVGG